MRAAGKSLINGGFQPIYAARFNPDRRMPPFQTQTGAILLPPFKDLKKGRLTVSYAEHTANLKLHLAYFDRVTVLPLNMVELSLVTSSVVEQQLVQAGKIDAAVFDNLEFGGDFDAKTVAALAAQAYDFLNDGAHGAWALCAPDDVLSELPGEKHPGLALALQRCLPCPGLDVGADEVIDFRAQNRGELDRLRQHLDQIRMSLAGADAEAAMEILQRRLTDDIRAVNSLFEKEKVPFIRVGLKVMMQVPAVAGPVADILLAGMTGGIPVGSIAGGFISGALNLSPLAAPKNAYPPDYAYVVSGLREGIFEAFPGREAEFEYQLQDNTLRNLLVGSGYPRNLHEGGMAQLSSYSDSRIPARGSHPAAENVRVISGSRAGFVSAQRMGGLPAPEETLWLLAQFAQQWVRRESDRINGRDR